MIDKKLGYYVCDNVEFDSKIQAAIYANKVKKPITWQFNNNVFDRYDWTKEPQETLDQLYDRRSRQIRNTYDYVILSYSGGADSHNILMSFIRQGLHLDEIIVNTMTKGNSAFTTVDSNIKNPENAAAEHELQTVPRLKELQPKIPKTKITIVDLSDHLFQSLEKAGDASWVLDKREGLNPLGATRFNYLHFNNVRQQFDKDKKIALVLGIEKPRTHIVDNKLYIRFADRSANIVTVAEYFKEYTNSRVEFFYWSPDCCDLLCKQGHIIKKWLEIFPEKQKMWVKVTPEMHRLYHERILRSLLYTTWDDNWYQADKAISDWHSEFDVWFTEGHKDSKANAIWKEGLDYVAKNVPSFMLKFSDDKTIDGLQIFGYNYCIGELKNRNINGIRPS